MSLPNFKLQDLIEAGVHFGHKSQRWNPKMSKYIHSTRMMLKELPVELQRFYLDLHKIHL